MIEQRVNAVKGIEQALPPPVGSTLGEPAPGIAWATALASGQRSPIVSTATTARSAFRMIAIGAFFHDVFASDWNASSTEQILALTGPSNLRTAKALTKMKIVSTATCA